MSGISAEAQSCGTRRRTADGGWPRIQFQAAGLFALQSGLNTGSKGLVAEVADEANYQDSGRNEFGRKSRCKCEYLACITY